ncbi:hypothetical protein HDU98_005664 [Podochytrium sp. JEL0797]|nr:hypothetical protein HDU98_005664 [Podochytrium sp. JEL0797]
METNRRRLGSDSAGTAKAETRTGSASTADNNGLALLGSKRDVWELKTELTAGRSSRAFFDTSFAVSKPFVSHEKPKNRNDLFAMNHAVTKPTSKMSEDELRDLESNASKRVESFSQRLNSFDWPAPPAPESFTRYNYPLTQPTRPLQNPASASSRQNSRGFMDLDDLVPPSEYSRSSRTAAPSSRVSNIVSDLAPQASATTPITTITTCSPTTANPTPSTTTTIITPRHKPPSVTKRASRTSISSAGSRRSSTPAATSFPDPPTLHLTFLPLAKNFLGEGRYASVYRANYSLNPTSPTTTSAFFPSTAAAPDDTESIPCAVKQLYSTQECFDAALEEVKVLKMMVGHRNIVQLVGVTSEEAMGAPDRGRVGASRVAREDVVGGRRQESGARRRRRRKQGVDSSLQELVEDGEGGGLRVGEEGVRDSERDSSSSSGEEEEGGDDNDEIGEEVPRLLIVLELASRGTMMDYIVSVQGEGVGQELWMRWAQQLASAVDYVHSFGYVHHDVKPHNCLLTDTLDLKLADFGNALPVLGFQPSRPPSATSSTHNPTPSTPPAPLRQLTMSPPPSPSPFTRDPSTLSDQLLPSLPTTFVDRFKSDLTEAASTRSSRTGSLTDGLGRGTQAYMAPEMFVSGKSAEYSFPVDMYSVGATLYVAVTGTAPFSGGAAQAAGGVYMMMGIRRGFWASGMQPGVGVNGPEVGSEEEEGPVARKGAAMRRSLGAGGGSGLRANRWLQEGEGGVPGGEGVLRFGNGERLEGEAVRIMCACLEGDGGVRPTARELVVWLNSLVE